MGEKVGKSIILACKDAEYFSIIFHITPDFVYVEQFFQIIQFVEINRKLVDVTGACIDFIPLKVKV